MHISGQLVQSKRALPKTRRLFSSVGGVKTHAQNNSKVEIRFCYSGLGINQASKLYILEQESHDIISMLCLRSLQAKKDVKYIVRYTKIQNIETSW